MLGVGAAVVSVACSALVWFQWTARGLKHEAFADQIIRLCHARNAERAVKLASAAHLSPMALATKEALERLPHLAGAGAEAIAQLREVYTARLNAELARAGRSFRYGIVVAAAVAVGSYSIAARHNPPWLFTLYGAAIVMIGLAALRSRKISLEARVQGERMFPAMAAAA
jgi:hypothetical protein